MKTDYKTITKAQMKKKTVAECLAHIYNNEVKDTAIMDLPKEKLADFVLEIFNKGMLNHYLRLGH